MSSMCRTQHPSCLHRSTSSRYQQQTGKRSQVQRTLRAMASEPEAQQSTACRLPDPIGQRRGAACLGGKTTLTAAETQQPMRTQLTALARERGEPSYASPA